MNQQDTNNPNVIIEDLIVAEATEIEVKGGPIILEDVLISGYQHTGHPSNHNETVSEDSENRADETVTEKLADLTVDEATEAEIIGGPTSIQWPYQVSIR